MSQVAIVIDLPHQTADVVRGNSLTRAAEDFARAVRKSHPVDDEIRLVGVYVADSTLVVDDGSFVEPKPKRTRKPKAEVVETPEVVEVSDEAE